MNQKYFQGAHRVLGNEEDVMNKVFFPQGTYSLVEELI